MRWSRHPHVEMNGALVVAGGHRLLILMQVLDAPMHRDVNVEGSQVSAIGQIFALTRPTLGDTPRFGLLQ